jgi:dihydrofolate reductase
MGKLTITEFVTLDGVAQAPGGPDEDRDGGFAHGGWQASMRSAESGRDLFDDAKQMDALLLGRRTYENFVAFWPTAPPEIPFTALLNGVPKYVASRTLTGPLSWHGAALVEGELVDGVTALTARHDDVHVIGSLNLVQSLLQFGLVDRLNLWISPCVLGSGKRVFAEGTVPTTFRLIDSVAYPNGTLHLSYETSGTSTPSTLAATAQDAESVA